MTKNEYIVWTETRSLNPAEWDRKACIEADLLIKQEALKELARQMASYPNSIKNYVNLMARCHYGSVETDQFLLELNCYPDWM